MGWELDLDESVPSTKSEAQDVLGDRAVLLLTTDESLGS